MDGKKNQKTTDKLEENIYHISHRKRVNFCNTYKTPQN